MKTLMILTLWLAIQLTFCDVLLAQKKGKEEVVSKVDNSQSMSASGESDYETYISAYQAAMKYRDFEAAKNALYLLLAVKPDALAYKDTLALLYYENGNYPQTLMIGSELLEKDPGNQLVLEIVAVSQQSLGMLKEALKSYEDLFKLSGNILNLYRIASIQYGLKRYGECEQTLGAIIQSTESMQAIVISAGQGQTQNVPVKAAAYNMKGVLALELNQVDMAKQMFEEALKSAPEFILAQTNLKSITEK